MALQHKMALQLNAIPNSLEELHLMDDLMIENGVSERERENGVSKMERVQRLEKRC